MGLKIAGKKAFSLYQKWKFAIKNAYAEPAENEKANSGKPSK